MTSESLGTIWVCVDCLFARESEPPTDPDREPWNEIEPGYSVTLGMSYDEHGCGRENDEDLDECDCEITTFSSCSCEGCGSHLAGQRQAYTLWKDIED